MRKDGLYPSLGEGRIHYCLWEPEETPKAVVQIIHGMAETAERYAPFAEYLNSLGFLVAAEDHMGHGLSRFSVPCYFKGGWMTVAKDSLGLTEILQKQYPSLPFAFLGHSMGSFLLRTILCGFPQVKCDAAVIMGTGWQSAFHLRAFKVVSDRVCRKTGEKNPSPLLDKLVTGSYNDRVEHRRTEFDWLCRDPRVVDAYIADPFCGNPITAGMYRDISRGLCFIENKENLLAMKKDLPVLFLSGTMDPVGNYEKGVRKTALAFKEAGMGDVEMKFYPLCRHEILNEINKQEVWEDLSRWLEKKLLP